MLRHVPLSAGPFLTWLLPGLNAGDPELDKAAVWYIVVKSLSRCKAFKTNQFMVPSACADT